jgi:hypothetical protein
MQTIKPPVAPEHAVNVPLIGNSAKLPEDIYEAGQTF